MSDYYGNELEQDTGFANTQPEYYYAADAIISRIAQGGVLAKVYVKVSEGSFADIAAFLVSGNQSQLLHSYGTFTLLPNASEVVEVPIADTFALPEGAYIAVKFYGTEGYETYKRDAPSENRYGMAFDSGEMVKLSVNPSIGYDILSKAETVAADITTDTNRNKIIFNLSQGGAVFADSITARKAVPVAYRALGQIITYRLQNIHGWVKEQFIGLTLSAWESDEYWHPLAGGSGEWAPVAIYQVGDNAVVNGNDIKVRTSATGGVDIRGAVELDYSGTNQHSTFTVTIPGSVDLSSILSSTGFYVAGYGEGGSGTFTLTGEVFVTPADRRMIIDFHFPKPNGETILLYLYFNNRGIL